MVKYLNKFDVSITEHLKSNRDKAIKKILDLLDMSALNDFQKKKLRKAILEEINGYYDEVCKVLTYIQENNGR